MEINDKYLVEYIDAIYCLTSCIAKAIIHGHAEGLKYSLEEAEAKRSRFISRLEQVSHDGSLVYYDK